MEFHQSSDSRLPGLLLYEPRESLPARSYKILSYKRLQDSFNTPMRVAAKDVQSGRAFSIGTPAVRMAFSIGWTTPALQVLRVKLT